MWLTYQTHPREATAGLHSLLLQQGVSRIGGRRSSSVQRGLQGAWQLLRDQLDPRLALDWLQPLLTLKLISDQWRARRIQLITEFPLQPEKISAGLNAYSWQMPLVRLPAGLRQTGRPGGGSECLASFDSLLQRRDQASPGRLINLILEQLAHANPAQLQGVFAGYDYDDAALFGADLQRKLLWRAVLLELGRCDLSDVSACLEMQQWWRSKLTLSPPVQLCAALAHLAYRESDQPCLMRDPFCGHGEAVLALLASGSPAGNLQACASEAAHWRRARLNLLLWQAQQIALLRQTDWSEAPALPPAKLQVTNLFEYPPAWDGKKMKHSPQQFPWGAPPKGRPEFAAISRMLQQAAADGQILVLVRTHCLQRSGKEQAIRAALAPHLAAVILLPARSERQRSALLWLHATARHAPVWFADYSKCEAEVAQLAARMWDERQAGRDLPWARQVHSWQLAENQHIWRPDLYLQAPALQPKRAQLQQLERECALMRREVEGRLQALGLLSQ
ncbi:N-6 DNA methylase [Massilia sp. W12]|uniref:N-6 DNA methylase n=1 Tax=Massilia sp. W12 TaxID=3126507 RepID=UPI0030CEA783